MSTAAKSSTTTASTPPQVCAITGGSRGIGLAIVHSFLDVGMFVFILDVVAPPKDDEICTTHKNLVYVKTDVSDPASLKAGIRQAYDRFQRLDCLVNNAAVYECDENDNILWNDNTTSTQINQIIQTNLGGVIHGTQIAYQYMTNNIKNGEDDTINEVTTTAKVNNDSSKTIVNVSSMGAIRYSTPQRAVYGATKAAILHFSHTADDDLSSLGDIRVFCICPGIVDTDMGRMGGDRNRLAVQKLKDGRRTNPSLVAKAVLGLVKRASNCPKEWIENCSYLVVDNHEILAVPR